MMRRKSLEGEQLGPDEDWEEPYTEANPNLCVTLQNSGPSDNL